MSRAWIGIFKPKREIFKVSYYRNYCMEYNKILHTSKDHKIRYVGGTENAANTSTMADGHHLEK